MSAERDLWWISLGVLAAVGVSMSSPGEGANIGVPSPASVWTTSSRLLKLGESLEFKFRLPPGVRSGGLKIYPRYLEQASPGAAFKPGGDLRWLESLPCDQLSLAFSRGQAAMTYLPKKTGNYMAEWRAGTETYYRYFSVIDDTFIILSFATFGGMDPEPTFHGMGIPLDYRYPIAKFSMDDAVCRKLLAYNRLFGELVVPAFPDMPGGTHAERVHAYGEGMAKARALLPDPLDHRSIRVDMQHNEDPGYPRAFAEIGVNDHCGLREANCAPWLGMPEFLYYASQGDCRKVNQEVGGQVVSHQWDFCGSFHFLGPVDWHYAAGEGRFDRTERCMTDGLNEFKNLTEVNERPAFVTPLYGGTTKSWGDNPNPLFYAGDHRRGLDPFIERYQRFVAFELPKKYKLVFTRSIDMVDYYRRHFKATPQTVFSAKTKHPLYDVWWFSSLNNHGVLATPERIPWNTRLSSARKMRFDKDSLSCEYLLIENQKRQVRFERECPSPTWWFDYTREQRNDKGGFISAVDAPDVMIVRSQSFSRDTGLTITLTMKTQASFPGYAIALWGLPIDYKTLPEDIATTAQSYLLAKNVDGETHMVLYFDLKPGATLQVVLRKPKADRWEWQ
jgi:hypothetical protein